MGALEANMSTSWRVTALALGKGPASSLCNTRRWMLLGSDSVLAGFSFIFSKGMGPILMLRKKPVFQ